MNMLRRFTFIERLAVLFALIMVFAGCPIEFNDAPSANYADHAVPDAPKNVKAKALSQTSIRITWDPVEGATHYMVYWCDDDGEDDEYYLIDKKIADPWYVDDEELGPDMLCFYKVAAYVHGNSFWVSQLSAEAYATTLAEDEDPPEDVDPPAAPTNVQASASGTTITITWNAVDGAASYNVYWSTAPDGGYTLLRNVAYSTTDQHTGLTASTTYYYRVSAVNSQQQEGARSDPPASATTPPVEPPDVPTGLTATAQSSTSIQVSWPPVDGAASYKVYWSAYQSGPYVLLDNASSNTYLHTGLTASTTYYYRVSAVNSDGESPQSSSTASATTSSPVSGSSKETAILLESSSTAWKDGEISSGSPIVWYSVTIPDGNDHYLAARDRNKTAVWGGTYTADVYFEVLDSSESHIISFDAGAGDADYPNLAGIEGTDYAVFRNRTPGTVLYIAVVALDSNDFGTFAIYFY
jgi:fibronectin type 3 domain-containing protein